ncbi:MAG: hypothetical protein AAF720_01370 [Pseudomonadota bacterium]
MVRYKNNIEFTREELAGFVTTEANKEEIREAARSKYERHIPSPVSEVEIASAEQRIESKRRDADRIRDIRNGTELYFERHIQDKKSERSILNLFLGLVAFIALTLAGIIPPFLVADFIGQLKLVFVNDLGRFKVLFGGASLAVFFGGILWASLKRSDTERQQFYKRLLGFGLPTFFAFAFLGNWYAYGLYGDTGALSLSDMLRIPADMDGAANPAKPPLALILTLLLLWEFFAGVVLETTARMFLEPRPVVEREKSQSFLVVDADLQFTETEHQAAVQNLAKLQIKLAPWVAGRTDFENQTLLSVRQLKSDAEAAAEAAYREALSPPEAMHGLDQTKMNGVHYAE